MKKVKLTMKRREDQECCEILVLRPRNRSMSMLRCIFHFGRGALLVWLEKANDKPHHRVTDSNNGVPVIVFDYCFLGTDDAKETLAIQVMLDTRSQMLFGHVVPRKGMIDEHGAEEMLKDLERLGYEEVILKCDEEPALINVQNTVKSRRQKKTITENSPVGDSRANGKAERAVQTLSAHLRVLKKALEDRCGLFLSSEHPVIAWRVEHTADVISKYHVGQDGHTGYERWKGKKYRGEAVEFGELVHYRYTKRDHHRKLELKWDEGVFLGYDWRTGEAIIGVDDGIKKAGTIRRVSSDRRWNKDLISKVSSLPWKVEIDREDKSEAPLFRDLSEEERNAAVEAREKQEPHLRMKLMREDFLEHGFTDACKGCKAIIRKAPAQAHTERWRLRMEKLWTETEKGATRKRKAEEKENVWIAEKMEKDARAEKGSSEDHSAHASAADPGTSECSSDGSVSADSQGQKRELKTNWHHGGKKMKSVQKLGVEIFVSEI